MATRPRTAVAVVVLLATFPVAGSGVEDRLGYLYLHRDGRTVEPRAMLRLSRDIHLAARVEAARTLASLAAPDLLPVVALYARDPSPAVRELAMLAAGRIGEPGLGTALAGLADPTPVVRQAAAWAACHGGPEAAAELLEALAHERSPAVLETALGHLWRLGDGRWETFAGGWAAAADPRLRRAAAAGLARSGDASRGPPLLQLAADVEPVIRATALGGFRSGSLPPALGTLLSTALEDPDGRVRTAACTVLAARPELALTEAAAAAVAASWTSADPHLAVASVRAAAARPGVGGDVVLRRLAADAEPWLAAEAAVALARRAADGAVELVAEWAGAEESWRRVAAVRAAAWLDGDRAARIRDAARSDPAPAVRLAWVETAASVGAALQLRAVVDGDPDPVVRAAALEAVHARTPLEPDGLLALARRWRADAAAEARSAALVAALRAAGDDLRAAVVAAAAADPDPFVAARVAAAARELGVEAPPLARQPRRPERWYRELAAWRLEPHWLDVRTVRGTFRIRLDADTAPITARELFDLARSGFYDGLTLHRVVPNFVVQLGDPRGDGWGGPGFTLPDEPSGVPFDSWRVGVATAGPHTGGSQLFVTLLPADRLTGHYTNVGEVVAGREVLTRLQVGDRVLEVAASSGPPPPPPPPVMVGELGWRRLAPLDGWQLPTGAEPLDPGAMAVIAEAPVGVRLLTVLGTWCDDSRRELPRLVRVLEAAGRDLGHRIVGVDRTMRLPLDDPDSRLFPAGASQRLPTVVVLGPGGAELGRVAGTPPDAWERVLAGILAAETSR